MYVAHDTANPYDMGMLPRLAKQYAATLDDQYAESEQKPGRTIYIMDTSFLNQPRMTVPLIQGTLRYAYYVKTKVSACGAPGAAED